MIEAAAKFQGRKGGRKVVNRIIEITPNEELFELMREVIDRMVEITSPRYVQISESWREVVKRMFEVTARYVQISESWREVVKWFVELIIIYQREMRERWREKI